MAAKNDRYKKDVGIAFFDSRSRAIAFHCGVFEALYELKIDYEIGNVAERDR